MSLVSFWFSTSIHTRRCIPMVTFCVTFHTVPHHKKICLMHNCTDYFQELPNSCTMVIQCSAHPSFINLFNIKINLLFFNRKSKVSQLCSFLSHKNILRFDITVNDFHLFKFNQSLSHFKSKFSYQLLWKPINRIPQKSVKISTFTKFCDNKTERVLIKYIEDFYGIFAFNKFLTAYLMLKHSFLLLGFEKFFINNFHTN